MLLEIIFIFIFTLLLVALLVPIGGYDIYRRRHPGQRVSVKDEPENVEFGVGVGLAMLFLFFILFPMILAASIWVGPRGPAFMGVHWGPIVAIGIILALMLAAILPRRPRADETQTPEEVVEKSVVGLFGIFFFIFLVFALTMIVIGFR